MNLPGITSTILKKNHPLPIGPERFMNNEQRHLPIRNLSNSF